MMWVREIDKTDQFHNGDLVKFNKERLKTKLMISVGETVESIIRRDWDMDADGVYKIIGFDFLDLVVENVNTGNVDSVDRRHFIPYMGANQFMGFPDDLFKI